MKTLCLALVLVATGAAHAENESPIAAAERALAEMSKHGKDVAALHKELDELKPEWAEIQKRIETFRPKMEGLMHKLQAAGGGESPIADAERALTHLAGQGKDVTALRTALDALKPDWDAIAKAQEQLAQLSPDKREAAQAELRGKVDAFRPRMEAFAQRVQALIGTR